MQENWPGHRQPWLMHGDGENKNRMQKGDKKEAPDREVLFNMDVQSFMSYNGLAGKEA